MATKTMQLTAPPAVSGGKRGAKTVVASGIACTPLDWLSADMAARFGLTDSLVRLRETFIDGTTDVPRGASVIVDSVKYEVKANERWDWPGTSTKFTHLILEMLEAGG
jgi:hypothetical protein